MAHPFRLFGIGKSTDLTLAQQTYIERYARFHWIPLRHSYFGGGKVGIQARCNMCPQALSVQRGLVSRPYPGRDAQLDRRCGDAAGPAGLSDRSWYPLSSNHISSIIIVTRAACTGHTCPSTHLLPDHTPGENYACGIGGFRFPGFAGMHHCNCQVLIR